MTAIPPNLASRLALLAYDVEGTPNKLDVDRVIKKHFKFKTSDVHQGTTGGFFWRETTGFVLIGQGHSLQHKGDHVIAVRGTASLADALTDATCHTTSSDTGTQVHTGFQTTFASFRDALEGYISKPEVLNSSGVIHCIGHSLGGALATLVADWIKSKYGKTVYLYTFGCPRVGKKDFAIKSSSRIDKIFRCVHGADPVAKVPVWPFYHAHINGSEYVSYRAQGVDVSAHSMLKAPGYINTTNFSDWGDIYSQQAGSILERVVLNYNNRIQTTYSAHWADKIAAALMTLMIDGGFHNAVLALQHGGAAIGSVYDFMASCTVKVASMAGLEDQVRGLLGHMLVFAGKGADIVINFTVSFIKWVFSVTIGRLMNSAKMALKNQ
ncbi:lipase family protein [Shewanella sp. 3_MG-2023]|uniref:lipase family protein n=1 Tax=Shewanella sp. 3_MG-2023 TaxID=3062635 RepID=UPI0026E14CE3|nr:lipase family protein [Shewanella sp. 3_MG-2023]MDO6777064.1 lipase family protein [Shewanella sp. 3_MG-2023]